MHMDEEKKTGGKKWRFGCISTWPGGLSAELEVLNRIKRAAEECDMECISIDNHGRIIKEDTTASDEFVDAHSLDFIISMHYHSPKYLDAYYYFTIWNPPEIPMGDSKYNEVVNAYLSFDDYLIYDDGPMVNHLRSILIDCPRTIEGSSCLMSSFPVSAAIEPKLDDPKLFYCGMNWDVLQDGKGRNESVMKLLDESGVIRIYGPDVVEAWNGVRPWAGYKCYQYPIEFDGFSIVKEINKCGICLVLSSDMHRRSGAVTNRAFEACAAGAIIISDDNHTMRKMFGDSVLYISYNRNDARETYNQIIEKYKWILTHTDEALLMAKKAQEMFKEKYSLNRYLKDIVANHKSRLNTIKNDLYAVSEDKRVLVAYICGTKNISIAEKQIEEIASNINNQEYKNIILAVAVDDSISEEIKEYCQTFACLVEVVQLEIFDKFGARYLTNGQILVRLRECCKHDYFMITKNGETWFRDHVSTLVRRFEDESDIYVAFSGQIYCSGKGYKAIHNYGEMQNEYLLDVNFAKPAYGLKYPYPGMFLFKQDCHRLLPSYLFDCVDGHECLLYLHFLSVKYKKKISFSKRLTCQFIDIKNEWENKVIPIGKEKNFIWSLTQYEAEHVRIMRNIDPFGLSEDTYAVYSFPWKEVLPGSRIIIYGGGNVGKIFLKQIALSSYCSVAAVCDQKPLETFIHTVPVISVDELKDFDENKYDFVLIAIEKKSTVSSVENTLINIGVPSEKIKWINPRKDGILIK